jgi:predicted TIM-barrel fold metal-dependent hydrolase
MVNGYSQIDAPDNLLYLDNERMTPLWEALTALDVPLYIHPRPSHNAAQYESHPELTGAAWGPYEDYAEGGAFIETVAIGESDRRKIAYDNAKALYQL